MKPGSLIEGLFDDVREVLQPAAFEGDLRQPQNLQNPLLPRDSSPTPSHIPNDIDKPTNRFENSYTPETGGKFAVPEMYRAPAENGTYETFRDRFSGRVTPDQYDNFVANQDVFRRMMGEWAERDDPLDRMGIIDRYTSNYGFQNNIIYQDLLNEIIGYDWAERFNPSALTGEGTLARGRVGRQEWLDWAEENINAATDIYGKRLYRQA